MSLLTLLLLRRCCGHGEGDFDDGRGEKEGMLQVSRSDL